MLDHVFTNSSARTAHAFEAALLQRQAVEERFQVDVFLGDVSFETSYSLPGEERPARIRVDTSLDWPTWSQTAYRSWAIGEEPDELPEVLVEIAFRVQGLVEVPEVDPLLGVLPESLDVLGGEPLLRGAATIEQVIGTGSGNRSSGPSRSPTRDRASWTSPSSRIRPASTMPWPRWGGPWPRCWSGSVTSPFRSGRWRPRQADAARWPGPARSCPIS